MNENVNILLVDDKPANLFALAAILQRPGYKLISATSGIQALEELVMRDFAVILLDVMMPDMDGFQLAELIKKKDETRNVPIIFLTAAAPDVTRIYQAYSLGGVDYLHKPLDADVVKAKVSVFVELFRKNAQIKYQNNLILENERREQEQQFSELKRVGEIRYRKLADAVPHIVWIANADGEIEYFNKRWFDYTGLSAKRSKAWSECLSALHPDDLKRFAKQWQSAIQSDFSYETECRLRQATDQSYRWHLFRTLSEKDNDGKIIAWLATFTDIEEQKRATLELDQLRSVADAANKAKSDFLAHMSHEIRTPLGAISGFTELILDPQASNQDKLEWTATIRRNCLHLARLVDDVLDLSKIEAGQLEIESTAFSLSDMLSEIQSLLNQQALAKGLYFKVKYVGEPFNMVTTDSVRLRQILINVIGNAIKFTDSGGVEVEVRLVRDPQSNEAKLSFTVSDTGPGLSEDQAARLFQPFMQADKSTSRRFGGSGLGLALSRRIAIALGGNLTLGESRPGHGSTFIITVSAGILPRIVDDMEDAPSKSAYPRPPRAQLDGLYVLLVEDSPDNQILFIKFLQTEGARVDLAKNGHEGVEKAMSADYDLIVMDIQMPKLDGYQAATMLRSKGYDRPIIALTAHVMKGERERCIDAGYTDYLSKPVNRVKLVEKIAYHARLIKAAHANTSVSMNASTLQLVSSNNDILSF